MKTVFVILSVIFIGILLTGCGFKAGDVVVAKHNVSLYDYNNNVTKMKPWVCNLVEGQKVVVIDTINDAGVIVAMVENPNDFRCQGGTAQSNFKPLQ